MTRPSGGHATFLGGGSLCTSPYPLPRCSWLLAFVRPRIPQGNAVQRSRERAVPQPEDCAVGGSRVSVGPVMP